MTNLSDLRDDAWFGCKLILGSIILGVAGLFGLMWWIFTK